MALMSVLLPCFNSLQEYGLPVTIENTQPGSSEQFRGVSNNFELPGHLDYWILTVSGKRGISFQFLYTDVGPVR
jgi:hypothetical protein